MVLFGQINSALLSIPGLRPTHLHIKLVVGFITGIGGGEGVKRPRRDTETHLSLASRFTKSGAILLVPLFAFMARTGITLRLNSVR